MCQHTVWGRHLCTIRRNDCKVKEVESEELEGKKGTAQALWLPQELDVFVHFVLESEIEFFTENGSQVVHMLIFVL